MASKITLADISHCDEGMILVARDASDGSQRHIKDVPSGLACNCICYGCRKRLVARKGDIRLRAHSFAHMPDESPDCMSSGESLLHQIAKDIIAHHGRVRLPATSVVDHHGKHHQTTPQRTVDLREIHLEQPEGQIVPDIVAVLADGRRIFIEIANTHPCPPEKLEKLSAMDVDVLEINVSQYRDRALDALDDIIIDLAPRRMIQSAAMSALASRLAEMKAQDEADKRARHDLLVAVYRNANNRNHRPAQAIVDEMVGLGFADLMDMEDGLPSAFVVERRLWQSIVLFRLTKTTAHGSVDVWDLTTEFDDRDWPKPDLRSLQSEESAWISANVAAEFRSPYEEIRSYLKRLREAEMVSAVNRSRFRPTPAFRQRLDIARLPENNRAVLLEAFEDIKKRMTDVDGELPDFDGWLAARAADSGETLVDFLLDERGNCAELLERLQAVHWQIDHPRDEVPPDDFADLPLETLFWRLLAERSEARQRAEEERERRRIERAADRVTRIRSKLEVEPASGVVDLDWLETPLAEHGGTTALELAAGSPFGLERAETALNLEVWTRKSAARATEHARAMYQEVEDAVRRRFSRAEEADAWLKQSWPQIGGVRAAAYCVDETKRDRCLQLLDETAPVKRAGRR